MAEQKQPLIQFITGTSSSRYPELDGDVLFNASIVQAAAQTSRSPAALIPRAGLIEVLKVDDIKWAASSYTLNKQFIWVGNQLRAYNLLTSYTHFEVVDIPLPTTFVRPLITDTFTGCVIAVDDKGYSIDSNLTVTEIVGANWAKPSSLSFVDGYTLLSVANSRFFNHSDLNDTTFTNALLTAGMAGDVDNIGSLCVINREVWLFGEKHAEVWYNSAVDANTIFTRQDGRVFAQGILSVNTITVNGIGYNCCRGDSTTGVFAWSSGGPQKISTGAVDVALENSSTSRMMFSFERNRLFIHVLVDEIQLWSLDVATQCWSLRDYGQPVKDIIKIGPHYYLVLADGVHKMDGNTDNGLPILSYKQTSHIISSGFRVFHKMLEIDVGGVVAELMLEYSDDGGKTWKNTLFSQIAKVGEFNRYRFHRLGQSRDRVYKLSWLTDSAAGIYNAYEDLEVGVK